MALVLSASSALGADGKNMTICTENGLLQGSVNGGITLDSLLFDNSADSVEAIGDIAAADTLTQLCAYYNARSSGDPVSHVLSLQGVNTGTGRADGTVKSSSNATCTLDPPNNGTWDGTVQCCTMTSSYTSTRGELLSVVLTCPSCTGATTGSWGTQQSGNGNSISFPYAVTIDNGTPTKRPRVPLFGMKSATKTYWNIPTSPTLATYNSDSTPDEKALKFTLDANHCTSVKLKTVTLWGRVPITGMTASVKLYDTDGTTVLDTITVNGDAHSAVGNTNDRKLFRRSWPTSNTLTCGSTYRIGYLSGNTTSAIALASYNYPSTASMDDIAGVSDWSYSERTDSGSWTDTATRQPFACLTFEDVTAPSGLKRFLANFTGGFQ